MSELLKKIETYWTKRAKTYSEGILYEMAHENEQNWMNLLEKHFPCNKRLHNMVINDQVIQDQGIHVLDIGTGPGFFAIGLAKRGYRVTAVDYTQTMLEKAKENAGSYRDKITFLKMDAHCLSFVKDSFDVIVTRNLTWNLERPQEAYQDWYRVLKKGGILLNFDAGWYTYLFDKEKETAFFQDRENVLNQRITDHNAYEESHIMEDISRRLILSRCKRPQADISMLRKAGFLKVFADTEIWKQIWDEVEKINFASTPLFMLCAQK